MKAKDFNFVKGNILNAIGLSNNVTSEHEINCFIDEITKRICRWFVADCGSNPSEQMVICCPKCEKKECVLTVIEKNGDYVYGSGRCENCGLHEMIGWTND